MSCKLPLRWRKTTPRNIGSPRPRLVADTQPAIRQKRIEIRPQPNANCYVIACPKMPHRLSSPIVYHATTCPRLPITCPMRVPPSEKSLAYCGARRLLPQHKTSPAPAPAPDLSLTPNRVRTNYARNLTPTAVHQVTWCPRMSQGLPSSTVYHVVACPSIRSMQVSSFAKLPLRWSEATSAQKINFPDFTCR